METLYRKVQIEINEKGHDETWLIGKSANFFFNPNTRNGEELSDFLSCCEEIPDNSNQIEKLEADKAELLHFLKYFKQCVEDEDFIMVNNTDEDVADNVLSKMNSLIQKMKQ